MSSRELSPPLALSVSLFLYLSRLSPIQLQNNASSTSTNFLSNGTLQICTRTQIQVTTSIFLKTLTYDSLTLNYNLATNLSSHSLSLGISYINSNLIDTYH